MFRILALIAVLAVLSYALFSGRKGVRRDSSPAAPIGARPSSGLANGPGRGTDEDPKVSDRSNDTKNEGPEEFYSIKRPGIRLLDNDSEIADEAAGEFELTEFERNAVQGTLDEHFAEMRERVVPSVTAYFDDGKHCFLIPALPDRGDGALNRLRNDLADVVGEGRAAALLRSIPIDEYFGGMGQFDVYIEHSESEELYEALEPEGGVLMKYTDPDTGDVVSRLSGLWKYCERRFPGLFDMELAEGGK